MALGIGLLGIHRLAQREPVITLWRAGGRRTWRLIARVITLMARIAAEIPSTPWPLASSDGDGETYPARRYR